MFANGTLCSARLCGAESLTLMRRFRAPEQMHSRPHGWPPSPLAHDWVSAPGAMLPTVGGWERSGTVTSDYSSLCLYWNQMPEVNSVLLFLFHLH